MIWTGAAIRPLIIWLLVAAIDYLTVLWLLPASAVLWPMSSVFVRQLLAATLVIKRWTA